MEIDVTFAAHPPGHNVLLRLRQFARKRAGLEHCELCGLELTPDHEHLVEPTSHKLLCACMACSILFDAQHNAKYKRVPHTVRFLENFQLNAAQWESLRIPIEMAFFFHSSPHARVIALYPSPAGAIESLLSLDTWDDLVQANPVLQKMEADVVALLVNRVGSVQGSQPAQYFLVPIDECYKLVGLIRANWRGLSGGTEVWREVSAFFHQLRQKSVTRVEAAHA
jgi:Family of unknown function (DUF5947)